MEKGHVPEKTRGEVTLHRQTGGLMGRAALVTTVVEATEAALR